MQVASRAATLASDLAMGGGAPLAVTEAARNANPQLAQDGREKHDVTAMVEYGRH
jgi:3-hydroxyisobutyrate dehydrogenase-like beta-hydroxyacid dehydrogenase